MVSLGNLALTSSQGQLTNAPAGGRWAFRVSLLVWALMLVAALGLIFRYGSNVPTWDDWDLVPIATGHRPATAGWLWSQHNEHRIAIPRLLSLGMLKLIPDFRVGMYFNVLTISFLALGMIFTARQMRGRSSYLDVFFPLAVMHWGQAINFLWCWQIQYSASILLVAVILSLIARAGTPPDRRSTVVAGTCVVLLPFCGANGLGLVPALAAWLAYVAFLHSHSPGSESRRNAIIAGVFVVIALLLVGLYFVGYTRPPYLGLTHRPRFIVRAAIQFLTMSFGPGIVGLSFDRVPMSSWRFVCAAVVALFLATGWVLVKTWWTQPSQRARAAGLLLFLAGMASLALGLGMGRAGFETRYVTLAVPGLCAVYLTWTIYGAPWVRSTLRVILLSTVLAAFVPNTVWGLRWAQYLRSHLARLEQDIRAGMPPYLLLQNYAELHQDRELMLDYMPMLRDARIGAFQSLRDDPVFHEISIPLSPVDVHNMTWQGGTAQPTGTDAWLIFELPKELPAVGLRLDYIYSNDNKVEPYVGVCWKASADRDFDKEFCSGYSPIGDCANWEGGTWSRLGNKVTTQHAWTSHPVQSVRLHVFERKAITVQDLKVLVR